MNSVFLDRNNLRKSAKSIKRGVKKIENGASLLIFPEGTRGQGDEPLEFKEGAFVIAGSNQNQGVLIKEEKKGVWQVQFGSLKMSVKQKDMVLVKKPVEQNSVSYSFELAGFETNGNLVMLKIPTKELDARTLRVRCQKMCRNGVGNQEKAFQEMLDDIAFRRQ